MRKRAMKLLAGAMLAAGIAVVPLGTASAGGSCFHETSRPTVADGRAVEMTDSCFQATVLRVPVGATVTWTNQDPVEHTVTGVGGTWGTFDALAPGDKVAYSFDGDGVYVYSCMLHPGMVGAVVVGTGRGDGALQPASGLVSGGMSGPATPESEAAPTTPASNDGVATGLVGGAIGIAVGLGIAGVVVARSRGSWGRRFGGTQPIRSA
jgi:plastocyanin